jgi:cold shock CspA family protein
LFNLAKLLRPSSFFAKMETDMETPVHLDFQGKDGDDMVRESVRKHVHVLEERFGRITACRVVVKAPGEHHRKGGLYEINIHLSLPQGREVDIARTATEDERHADLAFALNDAFKRARRRLQDHARRMQGHIKAHDGEPTATVARLDGAAGFGVLQTGDGREIYFHRNSVLNDGFSRLALGSRVAFAEEMGEKGPQASTVKLLGKHSLR